MSASNHDFVVKELLAFYHKSEPRYQAQIIAFWKDPSKTGKSYRRAYDEALQRIGEPKITGG